MSVSISDWLREIGLEQYAELFVRNEVDLPTLKVLTDDDLKELGLPFGPRKRVLAALRAGNASEPAAQAALTPEGERRQLTVLFCDLVGSTELTLRVDPELLETIIGKYEDACAACIGHYDGYVYRLLGDGVLAFFGFPLAHEGEAARAIRAGWRSWRPYRAWKCRRSAVSRCASELPLELWWWRQASGMSWAKP